MTQRTIPADSFSGTPTRQPRVSSTRRDPWWIPLGEAIASLFARPVASPDAAAKDLPSEVLRDYDPALHRALAARVAGRDLDAGARPLLY